MCPASDVVGEGIEDADGERRSHPLSDRIRGEPLDLLGFVSRGWSSADRTAAEDECNHAPGHVLVDAGQVIDGNLDACLFEDFAADAFIEGLAEFEHSPGSFPPAVVASLDHEDTAVTADDNARHADEVRRSNAAARGRHGRQTTSAWSCKSTFIDPSAIWPSI
jgi:hypothetical protein